MELALKVGEYYVCNITSAIFQIIYIDTMEVQKERVPTRKGNKQRRQVPPGEEIIYVCNPSADTEAATLRIPATEFRVFDMIDKDKAAYVLPNDEYEDALKEARQWIFTFRFYNRILYCKARDIDCMTIDYAVMQDIITPCSVLDGVFESQKFFETTASWKSFKSAQKMRQLNFLNRYKWLQAYQPLIRSIMSVEPKTLVPPRLTPKQRRDK